jgi:NHLM bacteriocin system ABC transporter ATP-binding protein
MSHLLNACNIIGAAIQQSFEQPFDSKASTIAEQVYEIALTSRVNYRAIKLSPGWQEQDQGPLLAFYSDSNKPVALIPLATGKYHLIDPENGSQKVVTGQIAKELDSQAFMFYRSLPTKQKVTDADVRQFTLHGRGKELWTIALVSTLGVLLSLFLPFAYQMLFDHVIPSIDQTLFSQIMIGLGVVFMSCAIFTVTKEYAVLRLETYLNHDLETSLWERFLNLSPSFFRRFTVGNLIERIFSIGEIYKIVSGKIFRSIVVALFSPIYLLAMLYYSPILTLIGTGIVVAGLLITALGFLAAQRMEFVRQKLKGHIQGNVVEMMLGLTKIRTAGVEDSVFASWAAERKTVQNLSMKIGNVTSGVTVANQIIQALKLLLIFIAVMGLVESDLHSGRVFHLTIGAYLAFTAAFFSFAAALLDASTNLMEMITAYPLWKRSQVILHEPIESSESRAKPGALRGHVLVDHVTFRYDKSSPYVHAGITLEAFPGEFIAIVGSSGSGKSTLMRLLLGFEAPEQGAIYYDGKDLAHLDLHDVRIQMGIALQNGAIFEGTVRENIIGGKIATDGQIKEAMKKAGIEEDSQFNLDANLTAGINTLSGGQKQRILLARAFLNEPAIMIWDEATNALDDEAQSVVTSHLEQMKTTRIVMAHRIATVQKADRIYVMDKGKIVDSGTFQELSAGSGMFDTLLAQQLD